MSCEIPFLTFFQTQCIPHWLSQRDLQHSQNMRIYSHSNLICSLISKGRVTINKSQNLSKIPIESAGVWCSLEDYAVNCPFPQWEIFTSVPSTSVKLKYKLSSLSPAKYTLVLTMHGRCKDTVEKQEYLWQFTGFDDRCLVCCVFVN